MKAASGRGRKTTNYCMGRVWEENFRSPIFFCKICGGKKNSSFFIFNYPKPQNVLNFFPSALLGWSKLPQGGGLCFRGSAYGTPTYAHSSGTWRPRRRQNGIFGGEIVRHCRTMRPASRQNGWTPRPWPGSQRGPRPRSPPGWPRPRRPQST